MIADLLKSSNLSFSAKQNRNPDTKGLRFLYYCDIISCKDKLWWMGGVFIVKNIFVDNEYRRKRTLLFKFRTKNNPFAPFCICYWSQYKEKHLQICSLFKEGVFLSDKMQRLFLRSREVSFIKGWLLLRYLLLQRGKQRAHLSTDLYTNKYGLVFRFPFSLAWANTLFSVVLFRR